MLIDFFREKHRARVIRKVEKALGFTLYENQKAFIFDGVSFPYGERRNGKTTAHILKLCLSKGDPIYIPTRGLSPRQYPSDFAKCLGEDYYPRERAEFFIRETRKIYKKLKQVKGLRLRKLIFPSYKPPRRTLSERIKESIAINRIRRKTHAKRNFPHG